MALTFAPVLRDSLNVPRGDGGPFGKGRLLTVTDVTLDTYTTTGLTVTAANLGLTVVEELLSARITTPSAANTAVSFRYVPSTNKLVANTVTAEVGNGVDLTAVIVRIAALGY